MWISFFLVTAASYSHAAERDIPVVKLDGAPLRATEPTQTLNLGLPQTAVTAIPALPETPINSAVSPTVQTESVSTPLTPATPEVASVSAAVPEAQTPSPTGFAARVGAILSRLKNPFGTRKTEEEAAPKSPEEEGYARFKQKDFWGETAGKTRDEIATMRQGSKEDAKAYVRAQGQEILTRIQAKFGSENLGFHFNLHGGTADGYVEGKGIRATMGDIANNYSMHGDKNLKVYFFQSKNVALYDILNETNPALLFFPSRMGNVLNIFRLDSPELTQAMADGRIKNFGAISMDFHGMKGVPYSTYVAPPLELVHGTAKKIGLKGKMSRDEETLATMRYIEAAALSEESFVP